MDGTVKPSGMRVALGVLRWILLMLGVSQLMTLAAGSAADLAPAWPENSLGVVVTIGFKAALAFVLVLLAAITVKKVMPSVGFAAVATLVAVGWMWMPAGSMLPALAAACAMGAGWRTLPNRTPKTHHSAGLGAHQSSEPPLPRGQAETLQPLGPARHSRIALVSAAVVVGVLAMAWLTRYEWTPAGHGAAFRTNRWTGETVLIAGQRELPVQPEKPAAAPVRSRASEDAARQVDARALRTTTAEDFLDAPDVEASIGQKPRR